MDSRRMRPRRVERAGPVTRRMRRGAVVVTALGVAAALAWYPALPERLPLRPFDIAPDDGPRALLLVLLAIWVVSVGGTAWLSTRPRLFNYPVPVDAGNAEALYREGERLLVGVTAAVAVTFGGLVLGVGGVLPELAIVLVVAGLVGMAAAVLVGVIRMVRAAH